jgi:hypothetical protein
MKERKMKNSKVQFLSSDCSGSFIQFRYLMVLNSKMLTNGTVRTRLRDASPRHARLPYQLSENSRFSHLKLCLK